MKYQEWLSIWLEQYIAPSCKHKTKEKYESIVRLHIVPHLGEYELDNLSPLIMQQFVTNLLQNGNLRTGKGMVPNSVNAVITVIQNSLRTAYNLGFVSDYNADKIKRPKIIEREIDIFLREEQKMIEEAVLKSKKTKYIGILLALYSGVRIGELLALEWEDLNLSTGELSITKTCHDSVGKDGKYIRITNSPKTPTSKRIIPLPRQVMVYMKNAKKTSTSKYIVGEGSKTISVRSYQRTFELLLKRLNIKHRGFHSLRHTFATRALECGMDVKTLSEILGHKSPTVTLNKYAHSMPQHKREMMNLLWKSLK